jgi:hypothetical protein
MTLRTTLPIPLLFLPLLAMAQGDHKGTTKVERSAAVEMEAPEGGLAARVPQRSSIEGDFDTMPVHQECGSAPSEELLDCTVGMVLAHIRSRLKYTPEHRTDDGWMLLTFEVDQYGDAKNVRVESHGDDRLSKAVIVSMYGMEQFQPARKGGERTRSRCNFVYSFAELFD